MEVKGTKKSDENNFVSYFSAVYRTILRIFRTVEYLASDWSWAYLIMQKHDYVKEVNQTAKFAFCAPKGFRAKNNARLGRKIIPIQSYRRVVLVVCIYLYFSGDNRDIRYTLRAYIILLMHLRTARVFTCKSRAEDLPRARPLHDKLSSLGGEYAGVYIS